MSVHKGRKEDGYARMIRARKNRPAPRSVPSSIVQKGFEPAGTAKRARRSRRENRVIRAWDNVQGVGEIVTWDRQSCMSQLQTLARKSGAHVHDGSARYNVTPVQANESRADRARDHRDTDANWRASTVQSTERAAFSKSLHRERRDE